MIETEIKLPWASLDAARRAVSVIRAWPTAPRRRLDDRLFDTSDRALQHSGRALRVRRDGATTYLTCKGPVADGPVKAREELETTVGDANVLEAALALLGYTRGFRAEKYREEYALDDARLALDETPMGVFLEIEAAPDVIERVAAALGRSHSDYVLDSYSALWRDRCARLGLTARDMLFDESERT